MARTNRFEERDKGYDQLKETFEALNGVSATVGVHARDNKRQEDGDIKLAPLLAVHEFGAEIEGTKYGDITIPARPVLRGTITDHLDEYLDMQERLLVDVLEGKITEVVMFRKLGAWAQGKVRGRFGSDDLVPNAPLTIELKGSSSPMIDDGQLRQSIDYQVDQ